MLEAKTIREIQAEIADIIDEKGLNQLKIMNCIAGLWLYGEELDTLYEKGEEKEIEIVFLKIGILADEISEAVDEIVEIKPETGSYKTAFNDNPNWRKVRKGNTYHYCFWERGEVKKRTLKDYYMELDLPFKSNQITLIKNGVYNHNQMRYIYWFDLKSWEEVKKYSSYIKQNNFEYNRGLNQIFNVHFLDYLSRNKINILDFRDYVNDCIKAKIKIQKPKNFQEEHMRVNALIDLKENEVYAEQVVERQKELLENEAKIDNAEFRTFSSVNDIVFVGKALHNCIARTYTHIYAEGKCDLYYVKLDGKIAIAIEVKNKKIIQARENHNKKVENEKARLVKKWAKMKGFVYG